MRRTNEPTMCLNLRYQMTSSIQGEKFNVKVRNPFDTSSNVKLSSFDYIDERRVKSSTW